MALGELGIVAIVFGTLFAIPVAIVAVICFTILTMSRRGKHTRQSEAAESQMIQEVYQGLHAFEQRIESLEALLLEREPSRKEGSRP